MRRIETEIIGGFLGSGKTTFINSWIELTGFFGERILLLQGEKGLVSPLEGRGIKVVDLNLTALNLPFLLKLYEPHRVIVEWNGFCPLNTLQSYCYKYEELKLSTLIYVASGNNFPIYYENLKPFAEPWISQCNLFILKETERLKQEEQLNFRRLFSSINYRGFMLEMAGGASIKEVLKSSGLIESPLMRRLRKNLLNKLS